jgi:FtsZ-binding cell division protein ZapB
VIKAFPDAFENTQWDKEPCDHFKPTADVAPKSEAHDDHHKQVACYTLGCREGDKIKREVAREIFEKIEESIATHAYTSKSEDYMDGAFDTIEWVDSKIDELKKKYTEDQNNENQNQT